MLNLSSISFQGNLVRQTKVVRDPEAPFGRKNVETTKKDLVESYDSQIKKIEAYKQFALKLDDLMFEDKDIQEKISSLPEDIEIELGAHLSLKEGTEEEVELDNPIIIAANENDDSESLIVNFDEAGPNKEELLEWLDEVENKLG